MDLFRKTGPTQTCIEPALVLKNQRVSSSALAEETDLIRLWIEAAERVIEAETNRSIMRSTYELRIPAVRSIVTLFRPGMDDDRVAVESMTVMRGGVESTIAEADRLQIRRDMLPHLIVTGIREANDGFMSITYAAGTEQPSAVPPQIRQAVLLLASHYYRNREAVVTDQRRGASQELPMGVEMLIRSSRIPNANMPVNEGVELDFGRIR